MWTTIKAYYKNPGCAKPRSLNSVNWCGESFLVFFLTPSSNLRKLTNRNEICVCFKYNLVL